ncbi:hypothetical protein [Pseudomonas mandelii]|uniref:hypothetical protein n=1 Tax=Pseudomonas mandelii TaxID=75612 RepID=UPI00209CF8BE|nr:hypothetical protein [Pseudomonas mandelii]MCO8311985.1 hypothetical protein [Pseudomonas mandelii]
MSDDLSMSTENSVLQDVPPLIPGSTPGVKSEDPDAGEPLVGVSLRLVESGKLDIVVDPPRDQPGDPIASVSILHNGVAVDVPPVIDDNLRRTFRVSETILLNGINRFSYLEVRLSGNANESISLYVVYSSNRICGYDVNPADDFHDRIVLEVPKDIGPREINAGVWLSVWYPFMKLWDVILVKCNGVPVTRVVGMPDDPLDPDVVGEPISILIRKEVFEEAGSSPNFLFICQPHDQLLNYPERNLWSKAVERDIDGTEKQFERPDYIEDPDNYQNDDPETIDRVILNKTKYLTARVNTIRGVFQTGDILRGRYRCEGPDGTLVTDSPEESVGRVPSAIDLKISVGKVLPGGQVEMDCELIRDDMVVARSYKAKARVLDAGEGALPPVMVHVLSEGNVLLPQNNLEGVNARAKLSGFQAGDAARLVVTGGASGAGSPNFNFKPFNSNSVANFKLPPSFIRANIGIKVKLEWILRRGNKEFTSEPLVIEVGTYRHQDPNFPSPVIVEAQGEIVDSRLFTGDANLCLQCWPLIAEGQPYKLGATGTNSNGHAVTIPIASGETSLVESESGLNKPVLRKDLLMLKNNSVLTCWAEVDLCPNENDQTIVSLPLNSYRIITEPLATPSITSLKDSSGREVGAHTTDTHLTVIVYSSPNLLVQLLNGLTPVSTQTASDQGISSHALAGLALKSHDLYAKSLQGSQPVSVARTITVLPPPQAPTIAYVLSNGAYLYSGGSASHWVVFYGTVQSRPYARAVLLTTQWGGGYQFTLDPHQVNWSQLGWWNGGKHHYHQLIDYDSNLRSNTHIINWA